MIELLDCQEEDIYRETLDFLNEQLQQSKHCTIEQEYPTILGMDNRQNMFVLGEKASGKFQIYAHTAFYPYNVVLNKKKLQIACIGSVVTHRAHRKKGYAKKLLNFLIDDKIKSKDFAVLWTNLHKFYEQYGFALAGYEYQIQLNKDILGAYPDNNDDFQIVTQLISSSNPDQMSEYAESILQIYKTSRASHIVRDVEKMKNYLSIPHAQVFLCFKKDKLISYFIVGKGNDLENYIHEWAGDTEGIFALLSHLIKKRPRTTYSMLFPKSMINEPFDPVVEKLLRINSIRESLFQGYLGLIHVPDIVSLWEKISPESKIKITKSDSKYLLCLDDNSSAPVDELDLIKIIFGPINDAPDIRFTDKEAQIILKEQLAQSFPQDFFIWGYDSV